MKGGIIYISSNREDPIFETKIIQDFMAKKGDLPVFSVTQRPMFLGERSLCVGDVGVSGFNFCRQLQFALQISNVDYVISCESDCLYSPDYFKFKPSKLDRVYRNTNNYVLPYGKDYWQSKDSQTAFQIAGRKYLLERLDVLLKGRETWNTEMQSFPKDIGLPFLEGWDSFKTEYACFGIKTGNGMRKHTNSGDKKVYELPYWGKASDIRKEFI